jgi:hypothetical protein
MARRRLLRLLEPDRARTFGGRVAPRTRLGLQRRGHARRDRLGAGAGDGSRSARARLVAGRIHPRRVLRRRILHRPAIPIAGRLSRTANRRPSSGCSASTFSSCGEHRVQAPEGERVGNRGVNAQQPGRVRHVIEIALRVARAGSSPAGASARIASQPFKTANASGASEPPAIITSARPARIISAASPIAWVPEAHAVETQSVGPCAPSAPPDVFLACPVPWRTLCCRPPSSFETKHGTSTTASPRSPASRTKSSSWTPGQSVARAVRRRGARRARPNRGIRPPHLRRVRLRSPRDVLFQARAIRRRGQIFLPRACRTAGKPWRGCPSRQSRDGRAPGRRRQSRAAGLRIDENRELNRGEHP